MNRCPSVALYATTSSLLIKANGLSFLKGDTDGEFISFINQQSFKTPQDNQSPSRLSLCSRHTSSNVHHLKCILVIPPFSSLTGLTHSKRNKSRIFLEALVCMSAVSYGSINECTFTGTLLSLLCLQPCDQGQFCS